MNVLSRLLFLFPIILACSSCSENFNVAAPYKPITVVYGLMDPGDTAHYIRIEKAFLDNNRSAIDMAKNPDSSFYSSLAVHLKEISAGSLLTDDLLDRVDLNKEGYTKDTGAFFSTPNYAYKSKRKLLPGNTYRLIIMNTITGQVDSAETTIIDNFKVSDFSSAYYSVSFPNVHPEDDFKLTLASIPANAALYEGIITFHWSTRNGNLQKDDSADYSFASVTPANANSVIQLSCPQSNFYSFLRNTVGYAGINEQRFLDSADLVVWAGSHDLLTYNLINSAQGGITADMIKPIYTNIRSNNAGSAFGLFTARASTSLRKIPIDQQTLDSIEKNVVTLPLNFQGRSDH